MHLFNSYHNTLQVLIFSGLLMACISSIPYVDVGLDQKLALPKDSFLLPWFSDMNKYLHTGPPVYFVVKEGYKYEDRVDQNRVSWAFDRAETDNMRENL